MVIHTQVIVLKSFPYGDTSLIARCFSKDYGKISFIVKGARSKKSPKSSQFQPISYLDIIYRDKPNQELKLINKADFRESWPGILQDLRSITLSMAILEMTEKTLSEYDPHPELFNKLVVVLREFNKKNIDTNILFWFYECTLLTHLGFRPSLDQRQFPGIVLPDLNNGPNSVFILKKLLEQNIHNIPAELITSQDRKIISNYLWILMQYHFDGLEGIKSMAVVRKILSDA